MKKRKNPPINCRYSELVDISTLKPHPQNPNKHNSEQIRNLAQVILSNGWRNPIVVSTQSGYIIKGNGRYLAAKKLRLKTIPVEYQNYPSESAELADMVADNKIAELSSLEEATTKFLLSQLEENNYDPALLAIRKNSDTEVQKAKIIKLKYGSIKIDVTEDEFARLNAFIKNYAKENGNAIGVIRELVTNGDKNYHG